MNMVLVLTGISLIAAVALGLVHSVTQDPIEASKTAKQQNAIKEVLPAFERLDEPEAIRINDAVFDIYKAYDSDDRFVGAAVESVSKNGFSGEVKVMVGFDEEGNIVNYSVLDQKETPGLGTKMIDWFKPQGEIEKSLVEKIFGFEVKAKERKSSIIDKHPAKDKLSVTQDGGDIDAITAATISSRAFLEAIRYAYSVFAGTDLIDANSRATASTDMESEVIIPESDKETGATVVHTPTEINPTENEN